MFTLRCTQKLLRRGLIESPSPATGPTTQLGDWYANVLFLRPQQLVLCVSERTLLPVIVPAKEASSLATRLSEALSLVLAALDIPPTAVQLEREAMQDFGIGRTSNKRVLGSLSEMVYLLELGLQNDPGWSLLQHSLWLAETPCKLIDYNVPAKATQALFLSPAIVGSARGTAAL